VSTAATAQGIRGQRNSAGAAAMEDAPVTYVCPGETHSISRAVHYARMAAFYPECRQCPHRHDLGHLPQPTVAGSERSAGQSARTSLVGVDGLRGTYLNEMTRALAERYAAAFAACVWEQAPLRLSTSARGAAVSQRRRPTIVVGLDDRPAAPDLVVGVAAAARRMGCDVIDVGTVSTPGFWCAVEHLEATGGIYVTGQGCGPAGIGLDFLEAPGVPWSQGGSLERLATAMSVVPRRTSRSGGSQRTFRIRVPYAAGLLKHFQSARAMRIAVVCLASTVEPLLTELFASLPCRREVVAAPVAGDRDRAEALALNRLAEHIRDERLEAGFLIADDGQRCRLLDEHGAIIEPEFLAGPLSESCTAEPKTIVLDEALGSEFAQRLARSSGTIVTSGGTREAMARSMHQVSAAFGCDAGGRYWFGDASPKCDALTTLGRILQLLRRSDAPASALRETQPATRML
jgi:phosphomannomutase